MVEAMRMTVVATLSEATGVATSSTAVPDVVSTVVRSFNSSGLATFSDS